MADKIVFPVGLDLPASEVQKILNDLRRQLGAKARDVTTATGDKSIPTARERFTFGGREFEVSGRSELKPSGVAGVEQEVFTANIKEIRSDIKQRQADREARIASARAVRQAEREELNLRRTIAQNQRQRFQATKQGVSVLGTEDKIRGWQEAIKSAEASGVAAGEFVDRANMEIRKLSKRFVDDTKKLRKAKFTDWSKKLAGMDPQAAIKELDMYIGRSSSLFVNEAKAQRRRLARQIENQQAAQLREQQRRFANNMLVASGTGLGLLGAAGFPLLNVGFAAMSGGVVGASIVGVATAVGELSRAIQSLHTSSKATSKEIGFVSTGFKIAEGRAKAFEGFIGAGGLASEQAAMQMRREMYEGFGGQLSDMNRLWGDIQKSAATYIKQRFTPHKEGSPGDELGGVLHTFRRQRELSAEAHASGLDSAYRSFQNQLNRPTVGIGNDPYTTWMRIQQSALDPTKQSEMEIARETLEEMRELVAIAKEEAAARKTGKTPPSIPGTVGGATGGW